ncbi:MAG TPA: DUF58 domain-containing protein [Polyangiaceae bacterium]
MQETNPPFGADFEQRLEQLLRMSRSTSGTPFRLRSRSKRRGAGFQFSSFRDYVAGDDFRLIDARASLRLNQLLLRTYEQEDHLPIHVLVDTSSSMGQNGRRKLNCAKRIAAAIACLAVAAKERVRVIGFSGAELRVQAVSGGRGAWLTILRFLEQLEPTGATRLSLALRRFVNQTPRRGVVMLIGDCLDPEGFEPGLQVLRYAGFDTQVWHVVDSTDAEILDTGDITAVDCETGAELSVTVTEGFRQRLRLAHQRLGDELERHCRANHIDYSRCNVEVPFERIVLDGSRARRSSTT